MVTTAEILRSYLELLQRVSEAEAVSLCLPAASGGAGGLRLVHGDGGPAVPELADADRAAAFLRGAGAWLADAAGPDPRPVAVSTPGAWLIAVPAGAALMDAPPPLWIALRFPPHAGIGGYDRADNGAWRQALVRGAAVADLCRRLDAEVTPASSALRPTVVPGRI